jgi:hypothetical protein
LLDKSEFPEKVEEAQETGSADTKQAIHWVGGRGCLKTMLVPDKLEQVRETGLAGAKHAIHWVGGRGKINAEPALKEQCVIQWVGGRGCFTKASAPDKVDEAQALGSVGVKHTIRWVGGRGCLTDIIDEKPDPLGDQEHDPLEQPSYQVPTSMRIEKPVKRFVDIDVKLSTEEELEYNDVALGDTVRHSDGQEGVVEDFDHEGDMKIRKLDGSSTIWYAGKCSKAVIQVGDVVQYYCGQRACVESFDPDGDIVIRTSNGLTKTWYKHKTTAPVRGYFTSGKVCGL